jgi:hypothetical protein
MTDFEEFWKTYPRRVAKGDARKAWTQTEGIRPPLPELLESIRQQMRSDQWRKNDGQFVCYPATWLRQERWSDELPCLAWSMVKNGMRHGLGLWPRVKKWVFWSRSLPTLMSSRLRYSVDRSKLHK